MPTPMFWMGKPLFEAGKRAMDEACCCLSVLCCWDDARDLPTTFKVRFAGNAPFGAFSTYFCSVGGEVCAGVDDIENTDIIVSGGVEGNIDTGCAKIDDFWITHGMLLGYWVYQDTNFCVMQQTCTGGGCPAAAGETVTLTIQLSLVRAKIGDEWRCVFWGQIGLTTPSGITCWYQTFMMPFDTFVTTTEPVCRVTQYLLFSGTDDFYDMDPFPRDPTWDTSGKYTGLSSLGRIEMVELGLQPGFKPCDAALAEWRGSDEIGVNHVTMGVIEGP